MRTVISVLLLLLVTRSYAQGDTKTTIDTSKWLRAFPITSYIVDLNDSTKVVQVELPDGLHIPEKELGVLYGVYKDSKNDAVQKGFGRCRLIKGSFHYFSIGNNTSGKTLEEGDIVYVFMKKPLVYTGLIPKLSAHFIQLQDVYENRFYDRYLVFSTWSEADEMKIIDSMTTDIRFTGNYFSNNDPGQNKPVKEGRFKDQQIFSLMMKTEKKDVIDFLSFMIAKPRLYAGRQWKISEVYATWLSEGAPLAN